MVANQRVVANKEGPGKRKEPLLRGAIVALRAKLTKGGTNKVTCRDSFVHREKANKNYNHIVSMLYNSKSNRDFLCVRSLQI